MDQFAQSREDDDLFGDEFEPVSAPTIVEDPAPKVADSTNITREDGQRNGESRDHKPQGRGRGAHRGHERGRGRGRGGQGNAGLAGSRYAPQPPAQSREQNVPAAEVSRTADTLSANPPAEPLNTNDAIAPDAAATDVPSPSEPSAAQPTPVADDQPTQPPPPPQHQQPQHRITSVRGDRSLTGGPAKAKLTEAELSEKMAKMAILNAQKSEKFRRTEADSAAFLQKEAEMKKKRVEEQKNAREMDKERARNRERKLKAQGGREWDLEKTDADIVDGRGRGRSSEFVRGGHGGVIRGAGLGGSRFADDEGDAQPSRGRGGFEIRGRGNRGRGGRGGKSLPSVPTPEDFPSLPAVAKTPKEDETAKPAATPDAVEETVMSPATEESGHDWAEEMATPVEAKKVEV
jgi:hypothetical protein